MIDLGEPSVQIVYCCLVHVAKVLACNLRS